MLNKLYLILGGCVPLAYAFMALMGWELGDDPRERLDPNQPDGVRHAHYWHSGFRGGK